VIDTHIHLFDPSRPGGVPWPEKTDTVLYRPALPDRYAELSEPLGIVGAIAVECSPWQVDNFWLQDVVARNPIMLGFVGDLLPEAPEFAATLDRLQRSPLFLGIRYGNLWHRDLSAAISWHLQDSCSRRPTLTQLSLPPFCLSLIAFRIFALSLTICLMPILQPMSQVAGITKAICMNFHVVPWFL
jgi:hypothetical protein